MGNKSSNNLGINSFEITNNSSGMSKGINNNFAENSFDGYQNKRNDSLSAIINGSFINISDNNINSNSINKSNSNIMIKNNCDNLTGHSFNNTATDHSSNSKSAICDIMDPKKIKRENSIVSTIQESAISVKKNIEDIADNISYPAISSHEAINNILMETVLPACITTKEESDPNQGRENVAESLTENIQYPTKTDLTAPLHNVMVQNIDFLGKEFIM